MLAALGCSSGHPPLQATTFLDEPLSELPRRLSEIGIYPNGAELVPSSRALAYEPGYELWSDGGAKARALVLPQGTNIDASNPARYEFPTGTLLFKTFSFRTPTSPEQPVPVETRLLRLEPDGWSFAVYAWDPQARDAELLDSSRSQDREVLADDGELVAHTIPSRLECRQCHESSESTVLGLSELQLHTSGSLDALAPRLSPRPRPPYAELPPADPLTTQVLGYLVGNCVHCHNGSNGAASSFDLRPDVALENLIEAPTVSNATAAGLRVVPGDPEASVAYLAMRGGGDREVKDMPPLGVAKRDARGLELFASWIRSLAEEPE